MNSLIKYGLYFVVAFSVLAFGAAEVWAFSVVEFVVFLLVFCCLLSGLIGRRRTRTYADGYRHLFERHARTKTVIASRKEPNAILSA
jgi:hypothetical protein